jgi:hypothetical protein
MENDFSGANYGQANLDEYDFNYPQDFYLLTSSPTDMDPDNASFNSGSQGIDNHTGQIESRPETPSYMKNICEVPKFNLLATLHHHHQLSIAHLTLLLMRLRNWKLATAFRQNPTI